MSSSEADEEQQEEEEVEYEMVEETASESGSEQREEEVDERPSNEDSGQQPRTQPAAAPAPAPKPAAAPKEVPSTSQTKAAEATPPPAEHNPLAALEEAAAQVQALATGFGSTLGAAFASAATPSAAPGTNTNGAGPGVPNLTSFAKDLGSWWSNTDKAKQPTADVSSQLAGAGAVGDDLVQRFGLPPSENLVEEFKCKLSQTYSCAHNTFTPAIQMAFAGTLSITDRHTCFTIEERGRKLPCKVAHADVTASVHEPGPSKAPGTGVLRLTLASGATAVFKDFAAPADLESALALIEHLVESCKQ